MHLIQKQSTDSCRAVRVPRHTRGFTLIEMMVALLIMALLAVAGYRGLDAVLQARQAVAQETHKWQQLMFFFTRMDQDVAQALPRPIRAQDGSIQPAWSGRSTVTDANDAQLSFTRTGDSDAGAAQQVPQRIGYRLDNGTIYLLRWPALDQPPHSVPDRYPLLHDVSTFELHYLSTSGAWLSQWPMPGQPDAFPRALEVDLTLHSGEKINRIFALQ